MHAPESLTSKLLRACAGLLLLLAVPATARAQMVRTDLFVTDGTVNAMAEADGLLYIGGDFSRVGAATGCALPLDVTSGLPLGIPRVAGIVYAVAPDGAGGWYVGGDFAYVGGQARDNLARIQADHTLSPWNPGVDGPVRAIVVSGDSVFVGGDFLDIGGQPRDHIAVLSGLTGLVLPGWAPDADGPVSALALQNGVLYVGGAFGNVGGEIRNNVAALDAATAAVTAWDPDADGTVFALAVDDLTVYAGGAFTVIGGQPRDRIAALDDVAGEATFWDPVADDAVRALAVGAGVIYAGGDFVDIGGAPRNHLAAVSLYTGTATSWDPDPGFAGSINALAVGPGLVYAGGSFSAIGGQTRNNIAALDAASGLAAVWDPDLNQAVFALAIVDDAVIAGGQFTSARADPRRSLAAVDLATGAVTGWMPQVFGEVHALAVDGATVYAGGDFADAGGQPRSNIAALNTVTGAATPWDPGADGIVRALLLDGDGGTLYVGGHFTLIGGQFRDRIAAIETATGNATAWDPAADGPVRALALSGTTLYAGGTFTYAGGALRSNLAALHVGTGLATPWDPAPDASVHALRVLNSATLFAGGLFSSIGGQPRNLVAALGVATGLATGFDADVVGMRVSALEVNGSTLYLGGNFGSVGGAGLNGLAAVRASSGDLVNWDPKTRPLTTVGAFTTRGSRLYCGGSFLAVGGQPQSHLAGLLLTQSVTAVAPDRGGNDGPISLTVVGSGFEIGAVPRLVRAGEPLIVGTQAVVAPDGMSLTATFDLADRIIGPWNVVVTNPDASFAVLENGFTIEPPTPRRLRVDVVGPTLIRANHPTSFDIVMQNLSNTDALAVPLWISRIPEGTEIELRDPVDPPLRETGEPDWSLAPLTLGGTAGRYMALVIPRLPPGITVRRITLALPAEVTKFELDAALTPPWADGEVFRACLYGGGVIGAPGCVGPNLDEINAWMTTTPGLKWVNGFGLWAKVARKCEGAGSLPAALEIAEQVLDYMLQPVERTGLPSGCEVVLVPRWQTRIGVNVVTSVDPNDKVGPVGYGPEQEIGSGQLLPYSIRFENLDTATAPAQNVIVLDALDPDAMDLTTMSIGPVAFGKHVVYPPPGLYTFTTDVSLLPDQDLIVRVGANFDPATSVLSWSLTAIDPATNQIPTNPLVGFLPPNVAPPEGEGSLLFTVMPHPDLGAGAPIVNSATIIFDGGTPIETNAWTNFLDGVPPQSQVLPLAADQDSSRFTVRWESQGTPPDLRDFSVYVSENGGAYRPWRVHTSATADTFAGAGGASYAFYSLARDSSGNLEMPPPVPDAETSTPVGVAEARPWKLSLAGAVPNPVVGEARVRFTLPDRQPAALEVMDVAGRRVWKRDVGDLGPGRHVVDVGSAARRPGLYFLRLSRGAETLRARMVVLR